MPSIFCYGTLRADYTTRGDGWGVMEAYPCDRWFKAEAAGYGLYQEEGCTYPFSVVKEGGKLVGTVLQWDDLSVFSHALQRCDQIEGCPGFYQRSKTTVAPCEEGAGVALEVYIYTRPVATITSKCAHYSHGDWLSEKPSQNEAFRTAATATDIHSE